MSNYSKRDGCSRLIRTKHSIMIRKQRMIRSKFRNMTQNLTCQQESLIAKLKKTQRLK